MSDFIALLILWLYSGAVEAIRCHEIDERRLPGPMLSVFAVNNSLFLNCYPGSSKFD